MQQRHPAARAEVSLHPQNGPAGSEPSALRAWVASVITRTPSARHCADCQPGGRDDRGPSVSPILQMRLAEG